MRIDNYQKSIRIRFYAELNDFLRNDRKQRPFDYVFNGFITVRDAIQSLGVPHSAVDLILVNGEPAPLQQRLNVGDYVSVYPEFEAFDISSLSPINRRPLRTSRFILDAHLGKVAKRLRMLGFDTLWIDGIDDTVLIEIANAEKRIIITRDKALLTTSAVSHGYYLRSTTTDDQVREMVEKFDLVSQFDPFTRCLLCNAPLKEISKEEAGRSVKVDMLATFQNFYRCSGCQKIFWEGSHYDRMTEYIRELREGQK